MRCPWRHKSSHALNRRPVEAWAWICENSNGRQIIPVFRPAILARCEHISIKFIAIHLFFNILNNVELKNTEKKCINFRRSGTLIIKGTDGDRLEVQLLHGI